MQKEVLRIMKFICETCKYMSAPKNDLKTHMNKEHEWNNVYM